MSEEERGKKNDDLHGEKLEESPLLRDVAQSPVLRDLPLRSHHVPPLHAQCA